MPNEHSTLTTDVDKLARLIRWIKQVLQVGYTRVPPNLLPAFSIVWPEIADELDSEEKAISAISNESSSRWRSLVAHGLTSTQLTLKLAVRDWLFEAGQWNDILDYIDSLLESLELGAIAEFKHAVLAVTRGSTNDAPIPDPKTNS